MANSAQDEFDALCDRQRQTSNRHPEDISASSSDNDSTPFHSENDDDRTLPSKHEPDMPSATYHIPTTTNFNANTGPKGVIADARSFESAKKRSLRQTLRSYSNGQSPPRFGKQKRPAFDFSQEKSASADSSADDDDEFMQRWRANRLIELANISQEVRTRRQSPSQRKYGALVTVDPSGYLDAVEKVPAETIVVVLIYDDESITSSVVEDALQVLARAHATTRFVKLHQLDAEMDDIAVPGILAYKGGECFANLVSIMSELRAGQEMNHSTLESILQRHRVLLV